MRSSPEGLRDTRFERVDTLSSKCCFDLEPEVRRGFRHRWPSRERYRRVRANFCNRPLSPAFRPGSRDAQSFLTFSSSRVLRSRSRRGKGYTNGLRRMRTHSLLRRLPRIPTLPNLLGRKILDPLAEDPQVPKRVAHAAHALANELL